MGGQAKKPRKPAAKTVKPVKTARPAPRARRSSPAAAKAKAEAEAYLETVIATGEAACTDATGKLPPGATHQIVADEAGGVKAVRRRFSAY